MSYREIETVRDDDGVIAIITERIATGHLSYRIMREYDMAGETKITPYLGRRHGEGVRRITRKVQDRIDILTDTARQKRRP